MALTTGNETDIQIILHRRTCHPAIKLCCDRVFLRYSDSNTIVQRFIGCNLYTSQQDIDNEGFVQEFDGQQNLITSTTPLPRTSRDALLHDIAYQYLLPIVLVLIAVCFVLGVILIVKSYMMEPLKQNLAVAIRRRRRVGHAPDNNYIAPEVMRASQRISSISDRKSLPPPEVLMAARERASQMLHV